MAVSIRRATFEDLEIVLGLWDEMMGEHERRDERIRLAEGALAAYRAYLSYHLAHGESCVRVAEADGGAVVGFCLVSVNRNLPMFEPERYGYLSDLAVTGAWRRRGIGRALFSEVQEWLRRRGIGSIQLQFYSFNGAGEAFWRAMGFKPFYTRMWHDIG